jgi:hypothetical protein
VRTAILLFVKFPEPGKVKTRLAATFGMEEAAAIYSQLVERVLHALPKEEQLLVMFDPPERATEIKRWIGQLCTDRAIEFIAQTDGDLGARLADAFTNAFSRGFDCVAAIGSDCPELSAADFAETWSALAAHDCVLGPTLDGGYYLVALKRPEPSLFAEMAWSTPAVFEQTVARLRARGLSAHRLRTLHDVDNAEDWRRAQQPALSDGRF